MVSYVHDTVKLQEPLGVGEIMLHSLQNLRSEFRVLRSRTGSQTLGRPVCLLSLRKSQKPNLLWGCLGSNCLRAVI